MASRLVRHVVASPRGYLVPRGDNQTLVGAAVECVGYECLNTASGISEVLGYGRAIAPGLGASEFLGVWAGLRPGTPDDLPIIGPFDELPNMLAATGHFRNGILLAPVTAEIVRDVVTGKRLPIETSSFLPNRAALQQAASLR